MGEYFEGTLMAKSNGWNVAKLNVDLDDNKEVAQKHGVNGIPHVVLYSKGNQVGDKLVGFAPDKLEALAATANGLV